MNREYPPPHMALGADGKLHRIERGVRGEVDGRIASVLERGLNSARAEQKQWALRRIAEMLGISVYVESGDRGVEP